MAVAGSGRDGGIQLGVPVVQSTIGATPAPNTVIFPENVTRTPRIAVYGDSRANQSFTGAATTGYTMSGIGIPYWVQMALGRTVEFPADLNFGVNSETTTQIAARVAPVAACDADAVLLIAGTNNSTVGTPFAQSVADYETIFTALRDAGKLVFVVAETPRGESGATLYRLSGNNLLGHMQLREYLLSKRNTRGIFPIDVWDILGNPTSTTGDVVAGYTTDGLHPAQEGARVIGGRVATAIASVYPALGNDLTASNADLYDATYNPGGARNSNPMLDGTTGTLNTGLTGQLATGWTVPTVMTSGLSVVASKVVSGNKVWQQFVISGTPGATNSSLELMRNDFTANGGLAGDALFATAEVEVDAGGAGYQAPRLSFRAAYPAGNSANSHSGQTTTGHVVPTVAYGGYIRTPDLVMLDNASSSRMNFGIGVASGVAVSATIRVRAMSVRKRRV